MKEADEEAKDEKVRRRRMRRRWRRRWKRKSHPEKQMNMVESRKSREKEDENKENWRGGRLRTRSMVGRRRGMWKRRRDKEG